MFPSDSQLPTITLTDSDNMETYQDYDKVMREQGSGTGKKHRDLTTEQRNQYRFAIPPPPDKRLLMPVGLKIKVGEYEWRVHEELVWTESTYIKDNVKGDSKVRKIHQSPFYLGLIQTDVPTQDNSIDLSEFQPELIARMVLYQYYEAYPISPDFVVVPSAKTVTQVMSENCNAEASSSDALAEPKFDCVLHLKMYVLGLKLGMKYLTQYAQKKFRKSLQVEREGFWACLEMLDGMDEDTVDKVDRRLRHAIEGRVWSTRRPFKDLEKLQPNMAAKISDAGKRRFGMP